MIPKRIVAIGTSSFFGDGDPLHEGYIGRLKLWHESNNHDNYVFNLGVSLDKIGETTTELVKRVGPESMARKPDLILLGTGINDIRRHGSRTNPSAVSLEQSENNIHKMIRDARVITSEVIVVSPFPIREKHDRADNYLLPEDVAKYAERLQGACREENVPYVDIYADWIQKDYAQWLGPDGVHANVAGYEVIFNQLKDFLLEYYKN